MNDRLTECLGSTLERRAGSIIGPPTHTADDIVRMGRRAARRRAAGGWIAATASATALVLIGVPFAIQTRGREAPQMPGGSASVAPAPRTPPTACTVERLAVPNGGGASLVMAMEPTGRYVVGRIANATGQAPFDMLIWDNGAVRRVPLLGEQPVPTDVNASGVVVGTSNSRGWVYRGGAVTWLPGSGTTGARAISDTGVIVGFDGQHPAVWRSATSTPERLAVPDVTSEGWATDISLDGTTVIGTLKQRNGTVNSAYLWRLDGSSQALAQPVIKDTAVVGSSATAIAGDWISGSAETPQGSVPARWNQRTGEVQTFSEVLATGLEISADGWLVGRERRGPGGLLVTGGQRPPLALPRLSNVRDIGDAPKTISADGRLIAGDAPSGERTTVPTLWRCQ